ncbi:MAG: transcription-repair coupling factor [Acinetobacter sp.]|nr:transcription-repair coupling factor [Acinetobacter sp.]DAB12176.1 MAG TPA: transcription-repair coupling factor [Candidatus Gastranaerophilales bacterium HUM_16]DAB15309.1 MAG TPA: transcription-repair coupling factor [Candidatus Gastranaerophilales bacterium HUM_19]DAB19653.1 MAG TPA: transcription-repair coupling factor [Candidatus Gastranaerophilales bacterium HUM_17]DAB26582.1 MAG TPA: transcription-repair coupling factor [Candidatus Gastranaerophilales bacterium HUM_23]
MKIEQSSFFDKFVRNIKKGKSFTLTGLTIFSRLLLLKYIFKLSGKKVLFITSTEQSALKYSSDLERLFELTSETLPYQNTSPYEVVTGNLYDYARQVNTLLNLPDIVIAPAKVLLEKFPSNTFFENNSFKLKVGESIDQKNLLSRLIKLGYKRSTMVSDIGEFSIRGDIADIYSLEENPVRVEFWGDEIIDIRFFNNETQKSIEKIKEITIEPLYKFILPDSTPEDFPKELQEQLDNEGYFEGVNVYQSYFNNDLVSVLDYFKDYIIVFDEYAEVSAKYQQIDDNFVNNYNEGLKTQNIHPLKEINHFTLAETLNRTAGMQKIYFNNFLSDENNEVIDIDARNVQVFDADMNEAAKFLKEHKGYQITIATDYQERVKEVLSDYDIFDINFIKNITSQGTEIQDGKILLLTDRELFNKRQKEVPSNRKRHYKEKAEYIESINDIKEGEYVVHSIHGVGVYKGLTKQEFDGQLKDYLTIEYANKDKLHIPAEQINMLCRYRGSGQVKPKLSRMGGSDWENTKTRVKKEVETIAYDLLRLYARRKMKTGIEFAPDSPLQLEMEDTFEYIETPDQLKSINQIKADMESPNPMDRLVCGDVGFGKTEVAMRAMFKAVTSLKQVAVIVPTTVLALQHYQTVSERFKPFGIDVELLCRFRSAKEKKETLKNLATGKCDVVIATHSLLQDNVIFKDLGLLVIDEEHRFGVRHKEKLKEFRENIDIISMSATPIPRTLYMSLSGIKDISVINTPPQNRLPIKTFVGEYNEQIVKNAIVNELDRDGQVFYLYNRVETIEEFKLELQKLVPNARIAVGHGQLSEKHLEDVIIGFDNHDYDILLCTTIIENGLDIPNANTMIIHEADKLGLAQLYQLRGRVGRSEKQAYCYCLYKKNKELSQEATERLKAIREFTTLGSGYRIAMRDVEIRGVGNILGTKQHGHMINVGFDTYCQLLEETVNELKGEKVKANKPTIVDINITAYIPDEWVGSGEQKMIEYKRLSDVKNETELDYIISEWKDRFSRIPEEVENLIKLIKIRLLATDCGITIIREAGNDIRVYSPFTPYEWNIIKQGLDKTILRRVKFTVAPKTCEDGKSILLVNNQNLTFEEMFNILSGLFYYIKETINKYQ